MEREKDHPSRPLRAKDLMSTEVLTARVDYSIADVCDLLQAARVHGAPVVDHEGNLLGFISQGDVLFGSMGEPGTAGPGSDARAAFEVPVGEVMTSPAVSASEDTELEELCQIMWRLRLHHIPIVRGRRLRGMVSSLDLCRAVAQKDIRLSSSR